MDDRYKPLVEKNVLKVTRRLAYNNLFEVPTNHRDPDGSYIAKVYIVSFLDALRAEGFKITFEKDNKKVELNGTK